MLIYKLASFPWVLTYLKQTRITFSLNQMLYMLNIPLNLFIIFPQLTVCGFKLLSSYFYSPYIFVLFMIATKRGYNVWRWKFSFIFIHFRFNFNATNLFHYHGHISNVNLRKIYSIIQLEFIVPIRDLSHH